MPETFSLRESVAKLEELEAYFQRPDMDIDEAIAKHKEALAISKQVLAYLREAESAIERLEELPADEGSSLEG